MFHFLKSSRRSLLLEARFSSWNFPNTHLPAVLLRDPLGSWCDPPDSITAIIEPTYKRNGGEGEGRRGKRRREEGRRRDRKNVDAWLVCMTTPESAGRKSDAAGPGQSWFCFQTMKQKMLNKCANFNCITQKVVDLVGSKQGGYVGWDVIGCSEERWHEIVYPPHGKVSPGWFCAYKKYPEGWIELTGGYKMTTSSSIKYLPGWILYGGCCCYFGKGWLIVEIWLLLECNITVLSSLVNVCVRVCLESLNYTVVCL